MDVDPVETQRPPAKKAKATLRTDKQRREFGEASYDPEATSDEGYEEGESGSKRKRERAASKGHKTKASKTVEIDDSDDETPVRSSTAAKKVGRSRIPKKKRPPYRP